MRNSLVTGTTLKKRQKQIPKYLISWTEELWYKMEVDADSIEDALDKFHSGDYDFDNATNTDVHLQDSVDIMEVSNG